MKNMTRKIIVMSILMLVLGTLGGLSVYAVSNSGNKADAAPAAQNITATQAANAGGSKALAAGICVGLAAAGGGIGMGLSVGKSTEAISRQPEALNNIRTTLMLGLVFIETAIIYGLIVAILVIFVL